MLPHQNLNMPANFPMPMSNESGFHETDSPKSLALSHQNEIGGYTETTGGSSPDSALDPSSHGDDIDDFEMHPIHMRDDIGLSDQDLVLKSTKDLNKLLKKRGISKERQKGTYLCLTNFFFTVDLRDWLCGAISS